MSASAGVIGGVAALSASASWAVSTTLAKPAIGRLGARAFNLFRVGVAFVLFWIVALALEGGRTFHLAATSAGVVLILSGALGLALGDLFLFSAVRRLGAQPAVAMNQLSPVWSALLLFLLGREHLDRRDLFGIAAVIGGVLLVIASRRPARDEAATGGGSAAGGLSIRGLSLAGLACGLGSSLCNATAAAMTDSVIDTTGPLVGSTLRMTGAVAASLLFCIASRTLGNDLQPLRRAGSERRALLAVLLGTLGGNLLQQFSYSKLPASVALCLLSTTPIFLLPLAIGILGERFRATAWLGTLLATAGVPLLLGGETSGEGASMTRSDPHSFARPDVAAVKHLDLDLEVDFQKKELSGRASLEVAAAPGAKEIVLDTRDLVIESVTGSVELQASGPRQTETPLTYQLGEAQGDFGRALTIALQPTTKWVHVRYRTSPGAAALQWLAPEQTAGGKLPFLFTQSQAILARTWIPLQDTPAVRMTYSARIAVPKIAGKPLLALMSAENPQRPDERGVYTFKMPQPIPSYLMALAVGDLEFRPLGARSGVYAEPSVVGPAANEFVDLEKLIAAAEALYGPYRWGRYDVIVLPPSFPFGGMENPRLTFATPTILAGDRSLVSLVAHELAHSWSGNLVTNATWNDFWLNEGFTVYFEHRIMESVFGKEFDDQLAVLGRQDVERTIADLTAANQAGDTHLKLDLTGRNPDDGVTDVAYEKGARFLQVIEAAVGRARFDLFLRKWFDSNAFQSRTTEEFLAFLGRELGAEFPGLEQRVQVDAWVYGPGLPANAPRATSVLLDRAAAQLQRFATGAKASALETQGFTTQQWQAFLRGLPNPTSAARFAELDEGFALSSRGNSEVLFAWLDQCVKQKYAPALAAGGALERFLTSQGRRKFLKPLYQELAKSDWGRALATTIYDKARPTYHAVSRDTIDALLGWGKGR